MSFLKKLTGRPVSSVSSNGRYDLVTYTDAAGAEQQLSGPEFEGLPFDQRINVILSGHPRFTLAGAEVPMRQAMKVG